MYLLHFQVKDEKRLARLWAILFPPIGFLRVNPGGNSILWYTADGESHSGKWFRYARMRQPDLMRAVA